MPTVPTYNRQVSSTPQPTLETGYRPQQTGQLSAKALGQAGQQLQEIAMKQKTDADAVKIKNAVERLDRFEHGLYDPKEGAFSRKGQDALNLEQDVEQEWQSITGEIEQNLSNDDQRQRFAEIKQRRFNQVMGSTRKYQMREFERYTQQQDQASLEISRELAVDNYSDLDRVDAEIGKQATILLDTARREGWSQEVYRNELSKQVSATHTAVIDRMAGESPTAALAYYEKNKDELYGGDDARVENILNNKAKAVEADEIATNIIESSEQKLSEWRKKAKEIEDPTLRQLTLERIESGWRDVVIERKEFIADTWKQVEQGADPRKLDGFSDIPSATKAQMESRYRDIRNGIQPVTNDKAWLETQAWDVRDLGSKTEDELFEYRDKLADGKWSQLVGQWKAAREALKSPQKRQEIDAIQTSKDRVKGAAVSAGIMKANETLARMGDTEAKRFVKFQENAERRFEAEQFARGRKLTPTEEQDILDDMVRQTVFVGEEWSFGPFGGEGTEVPIASIVQGDFDEGVYVPSEQIPPRAMAELRSIIESNGWQRGDVEERMQRAYAYLLMYNEQAAYEILQGDN